MGLDSTTRTHFRFCILQWRNKGQEKDYKLMTPMLAKQKIYIYLDFVEKLTLKNNDHIIELWKRLLQIIFLKL